MLKKLGLTTSLVTILTTSTAMADLAGARGTLNNIDSAVNKAVTEASRLFEQNQGRSMNKVELLKSGENPYLKRLTISPNYHVQIQLSGDTGKERGGMESPVAKGLLGMQIELLPVFNKKDEKVTAWECVTNADRNIQEFMGDEAKEFAASYIREATNNTYLSLCIYINKEKLF